jgi:hypothetical protein
MDNKQLTKLLSYFVMGDGGVYVRDEGDNAYFAMNMLARNDDYIKWVEATLNTFVGTSRYDRKDYNTDGCTRQPQIRLQSKTHPKLTALRDRIYTGTYKGVDPHALKLLDWEAMAILFMCDGSLVEDKPNPEKRLVNSSWNLTLNMKRLSYGDQMLLKRAVKDTLNVEFNINRQGKYYYMRLRCKDVEKFCRGVEPYMKDSFKYKIRVIDPLKQGGEIVCSVQ